MSIIEIRGLSAGYGRKTVLSNLNLVITKPSFVSVIGPNGAGKTTLLRVLAGLLRPRGGLVKILGVDVSKKFPSSIKVRLGYVPQRDSINYAVPVTVFDVIVSGLIDVCPAPRTVTKRDVRQRACRVASALGIDDLLDSYFYELSGGLQQRVLLARALIKDPDILLLDEPLSNLDEATQQEVLKLLRHLVDKHLKTVIMVTHDLDVALEWSDLVVLISRGGARTFKPGVHEDVERLLESYPEEERKIIPSRRPYCG